MSKFSTSERSCSCAPRALHDIKNLVSGLSLVAWCARGSNTATAGHALLGRVFDPRATPRDQAQSADQILDVVEGLAAHEQLLSEVENFDMDVAAAASAPTGWR
jgi:hypothetical protein